MSVTVDTDRGEIRTTGTLRIEGSGSIIITIPPNIVQNTPQDRGDQPAVITDGSTITLSTIDHGRRDLDTTNLRRSGRSTVATITSAARTVGLEPGDDVIIAARLKNGEIEIRPTGEE